MTDKEKLEKIVAYLMRRMYAHNQKADIGSTGEIFDEKIENAKYEECRDTLNFIDSMQEECNITSIKSKEATGKLKECIDNVSEESLAKARKQLEEEFVNGGLDLGCGVIWKDEKSASEDLEEVIRKYEQRLEKENPQQFAYCPLSYGESY